MNFLGNKFILRWWKFRPEFRSEETTEKLLQTSREMRVIVLEQNVFFMEKQFSKPELAKFCLKLCCDLPTARWHQTLSNHKSDTTHWLSCLFCLLFSQVCADVRTPVLAMFPSMNFIKMNNVRQNLKNETWHFTIDLRQIIVGAIANLPQEHDPEQRAKKESQRSS